jgi:hypothetical protein
MVFISKDNIYFIATAVKTSNSTDVRASADSHLRAVPPGSWSCGHFGKSEEREHRSLAAATKQRSKDCD